VLGNHDLHLLMVAAGLRSEKRGDTLAPILAAADRDDLLDWLRAQPLVHRADGLLLVHGGLWPTWTPAEAERIGKQASAGVRSGAALAALAAGVPAAPWNGNLRGAARAAAALRLMTTLRMLDAGGAPLKYAGPPGAAPRGAIPWYDAPDRRSRDVTVLFGHWAAHDFLLRPGPGAIIALDSGCVWGRALTAVRLDDLSVFQEPAADGAAED
jgi:bis(5'-nucleosyl)-tetraphosphatase (symmetrical)